MTTMLRVAAAQFSNGTDVEENLATTLRMIDAAAAEGAELVVLPEFCNHLSVYDDAGHAWAVAVEPRGAWHDAIGAAARRHRMWIQVNVTLRREPGTPSHPRARITNTNLVFDPVGVLRAANDKTVLMGAENEYLTTADRPSALVDAPFGRIGTYACMDGVVPEVPRSVAVRGARIMLNSLNSFALDEASLHIPVRAAENRTWVVACCKVGPLLPADKVAAFSEAMGVPREMLNGAGESQIVAPDGTVVAKGPRDGDAVVVADIDLDRAGERRPDGTDVTARRRPIAYARLARPTAPPDEHRRSDELVVATGASVADVPTLVARGAQLVVLPELALEAATVDTVTMALAGTTSLVVSSIADGDRHVGVAIDADGIRLRQPQMHPVARHAWATSHGDDVMTLDLDWGRLAIVVGDDVVHPEVARLAALASVDVIALPLDAQESWELPIGVVERAAENRMNAVAANRPGGPLGDAGRSVAADLPPDFTLWAPSRERVFDGTINRPDLTWSGDDGVLVTTVHPGRSVHRQISRDTDLVSNRPWKLFDVLAG